MYQKLIDMFFASATEGLLACPTGIVSWHFDTVVQMDVDNKSASIPRPSGNLSRSLKTLMENQFFVGIPRRRQLWFI